MNKSKSKLSWTPVRRDELYCSPACGFKCKWEAYADAISRASELARKLSVSGNGAEWEPHVWENMGWHYSARRGGMKVHPPRGSALGTYIAFLGEDESSGGRWAEHGATPEEAIRNTVSAAKEEIAALEAILGDWRETGTEKK